MDIQALWTAWWYTEICQDDLIYGHSHESKIGTIWEEEHRLRVRVSVIWSSSVLKHRHYLCTKLQHEQMIDVPLSYLYDPLPQCFLLGSLLHTTPEVFTPKSHKKKSWKQPVSLKRRFSLQKVQPKVGAINRWILKFRDQLHSCATWVGDFTTTKEKQFPDYPMTTATVSWKCCLDKSMSFTPWFGTFPAEIIRKASMRIPVVS